MEADLRKAIAGGSGMFGRNNHLAALSKSHQVALTEKQQLSTPSCRWQRWKNEKRFRNRRRGWPRK